jgi:hypothetical protein
MKELLTEFLATILKEAGTPAKIIANKTDAKTKRVVRTPGTVWQTAGKKWSAKRMDGTSEYGFDSEEAARVWLAGTEKTPDKIGSMGREDPELTAAKARLSKSLAAATATKQGTEKPTTSGPDTPPGYMSKSSASAGIVGSLESTEDNPNPMRLPVRDGKPLPVRCIMDGDTPVDVREQKGRDRAVAIIDARLREIQDITIQACKDFTGNIQAQKWLGEVGELHALKEILQAGKEAYLMPDSKAESDLVIIGRREVTTEDTVTTELTVVEISVKSSTKEEVGQRGANARAPILRMLDGKNITLPGVGEVSASSAASIVYDIREQLGYFLTDDVAVKEPGKKKRQLDLVSGSADSGSANIPRAKQLDRFTPQYQIHYRDNEVENGVPTRENQGYFERSRLVEVDDVDAFRARLTTHIAKNYPAEDQEKQIQIMEHYLSKLTNEIKANKNYTLAELRNFLMENVGKICDNTNPPTDAIIQSDLVGLKFDATTGKPTVSVAQADAVRQCIDEAEKAARDKKVGDVVGDKPLTDPASASQTVGDVLDANCYDSNGRMKWKCQFSKFLKPVWIAQARVSKSTGRGGIQFKLNWASPAKCTKTNSKPVKEYVDGM